MKLRFSKKGNIAKYAITGKKNKLIKFEQKLKDAGYSGVISNEAARGNPYSVWIVLYHNNVTGEKVYAYRTHNSSETARTPPRIVSISKMTKILK